MSLHDKIDGQGILTFIITTGIGAIAAGCYKMIKIVFTDRQRIDSTLKAMDQLSKKIEENAQAAEKRDAERAKQREEDRAAVKDELRELKDGLRDFGTEIKELFRRHE